LNFKKIQYETFKNQNESMPMNTWLHSTVMMNIACDRELCSFMFVALNSTTQ